MEKFTGNNLLLKKLLAAFLLTLAVARAEMDMNNLNVDAIKNQLPDELAKQNMTLDKAKNMLKDKCIQTAGEEEGNKAFEGIENGVLEFTECIGNVINFTAIQTEIDQASPTGELDVVFHKYCSKKPEALNCTEQLNAKFTPCLDKEERDNQNVFMKIMKSLLDFVCHKGGDQIALFIAEKGPECLKSKQDDIQSCINSTLSGYMPKDGPESINTIPKLVIDKKHCQDIDKLETCIVAKLETCEEITPANIVESMFRFIRNETICKANKKSSAAYQSSSRSAGSSTSANLITTLSGSLLMIFSVFVLMN